VPRGRDTENFKRLKRVVYSRGAVCCRCGQNIDYSIPYRDPHTGVVNVDSKSVDHYPHPLSTHPHLAEDLSNLAAAHLRCNLSAGTKSLPPLGVTSRDW
jgi:5-methylcytosine-specific restriction endonuclease McrA